MISIDTFFTTIITLSVFYGTILITLIIAKKNNPSLHIKCYIIILTVICVLFTLTASILYFGHMPFLSAIFLVKEYILSVYEETSFAFENFYVIYFCGIIGFLPIGILCSYLALNKFEEVIIFIFDIETNIAFAIACPYHIGTFIYAHLYTISFLLTALAALFANLLISCTLFGVFFILEEVDKRI